MRHGLKRSMPLFNIMTEEHEKNIIKAVETQAKDHGLWFINVAASEAYLQQALRDLHRVIEDNDEQALARIIDCQDCSSN